jgi:YidC/Oxa1 family membrane protein insertase
MDKRSIFFVLALTVSLFFVHQWFNTKDGAPVPKPQQQTVSEAPAVLEKEAEIPQEFPEAVTSAESQKEQFYVLENAYQQLVFSTLGGALAEINLPLHSDKNEKSIVLEIDFDRIMQKNYYVNDYFPSSPYKTSLAADSAPVPGTLGGYYPLIRRGIQGPSGHNAFNIPPHYYAMNLVSEDPDTANLSYRVKRLEKDLIEFEAVQGHRRIVKTYSFPKNPDEAPYCFNLSIKIEGDARGLWLTSGVPEVELISGNPAPTLKYRLTRSQKAQVEQVDLPKTAISFTSIQPDWICNSNGFMGIILDPLTEVGSGFSAFRVPGELDPTRLTLIDAQYNLYPTDKYPGYEMHLPLRATGQSANFRVYAGPFQEAMLKKVDAAFSDPATGYNPNYISALSFHGWFTFISEPFAKFLFILMKFFYQISHSWGISIILLTIALRVMLYPLNAWSIKSTTRMQQVAPQVAALQAKYKKDPKRAQMEIMTLYREKGVNPLGGCFPILIQLPFLIGMFDLLKSTFDLRGASFIPGWINNLTAPDVLFSWNYPLIFFGTQFHLLPLILGAVMYMQQKFSSPLPKDKSLLTDQQKQQKFMGNIMVIVFTVMFYHFPSGLNLYWLSSMLLGILQQWYMSRKLLKEKPKSVVTTSKK